nr:retrovirus-related Pol polyprotein from transposon TNT 1-94 [Tanacetum cinerariifolium]
FYALSWKPCQGDSLNLPDHRSKAFRVFNSRTKIVQETLQIIFLENQPNVTRSGPTWLFDIDTLTRSMNYQPVVAGNQPNSSADPQNTDVDAAFDVKENEVNAASAPITTVEPNSTNSTNSFNAAGPFDNVVSLNFETDDEVDVGAEVDFSNLETSIAVSLIPTTRVHGHTQEEGIDYEEIFALVPRIEAIWLFLAYASFMGFMVYQMDVKSTFLYGTIKEDVYVCQPLRFKDLDYLDKVYKVVKALYRLHQPLRAWYKTLANYLLKNGFQIGKTDQTLLIKKKKVIFCCQDKYVAEILRKFGLTYGKLASTPIDTEKPLLKDPDGDDVDVHIYRHFLNAVSSKLMLFGLTIDATYLMLLFHKKSNDVMRLQALIDRKNVIITEDTIRQALHLDDVAGVDCLLNEEIFAMLARMGCEKLSIKLTFYKAFFSA